MTLKYPATLPVYDRPLNRTLYHCSMNVRAVLRSGYLIEGRKVYRSRVAGTGISFTMNRKVAEAVCRYTRELVAAPTRKRREVLERLWNLADQGDAAALTVAARAKMLQRVDPGNVGYFAVPPSRVPRGAEVVIYRQGGMAEVQVHGVDVPVRPEDLRV